MEFSKCVRRHHVTNESGFPVQPLFSSQGVTACVRPFCMSTTVPYWSNMQTLILLFSVAASICLVAFFGLVRFGVSHYSFNMPSLFPSFDRGRYPACGGIRTIA